MAVLTKISLISWLCVFNFLSAGTVTFARVANNKVTNTNTILAEGENVKINLPNCPETNANNANTNGEVVFDCELTLPPASITPIEIHILNSTYQQQIDFGVIEVHVEYKGHNISLAYNRTLIPNYYQTGTHLGLIIYGNRDANDESNHNVETIYIHNTENGISDSYEPSSSQLSSSKSLPMDNGTEVGVMIAFIAYYRNNKVPVPGGCNLEYSMVQDAPIVLIQQCDGLVHVDTPLALAATAVSPATDTMPTSAPSACDTNNTKNLIYENRYLYLPSDVELSAIPRHDYFNYIRLMLTADDAVKNGKSASSKNMPANRQSFLIMPGTNMLFVTIVRNASDGNSSTSMAAYVPTLYSWNEYNLPTNMPWYQSRPFWIMVATAFLLIGLIKGFVNNANIPIAVHLLFAYINIFICMVLTLAIVYMIISNEPAASTAALRSSTMQANIHLINWTTIVPLALVLSVVVFVCCGYCGGCSATSPLDSAVEPFQQAVQYVTLQIAVVFFITSFLVYYASTNDVACTPEMYGIYWVFTSAIIMVIMPAVIGWYWNELILNAMWGSFLLTMAIAIYLQNPLQIICVYAIRFIIDLSAYRTALTPPIGVEALILIAIWKILAIIGAVIQHRQYKMICRSQWHGQQQQLQQQRRIRGASARSSGGSIATDLERTGKSFALHMRPNEQTPLLRREKLIH